MKANVEVDLGPEAAMKVAHIAVVLYIREDGKEGYAVSCGGNVPVSSLLGACTFAEQAVLKWHGDAD